MYQFAGKKQRMNQIQKILPKNEEEWLAERSKDITSTEVSSLFGISPYTTLFETWHRHAGNIAIKFEPNERTVWGNRLEESIAKGVAEDNKWQIRRMNEYLRDPKKRIGASFDFSIDEIGILEIKNVDALMFRDGWQKTEDGDLEAPPHIEMQIQHQLAVSGRAYAYLGALIGGNTIKLIKREPDDVVIKAIYKKSEQFWNTIADKTPPQPDFSKDTEAIKRLYSQSSKGKFLDVRGNLTFTDLINEYREAGLQIKEWESKKEAAKNQILTMAEDAEKIIGENFTVSMGIVKGGPVSYDRADYRMFKPSYKKEVKS